MRGEHHVTLNRRKNKKKSFCLFYDATCHSLKRNKTTHFYLQVLALFGAIRICSSTSLQGQPKVNKVKIFLPFWKFMKRPQTKLHAHTMRQS